MRIRFGVRVEVRSWMKRERERENMTHWYTVFPRGSHLTPLCHCLEGSHQGLYPPDRNCCTITETK